MQAGQRITRAHGQGEGERSSRGAESRGWGLIIHAGWRLNNLYYITDKDGRTISDRRRGAREQEFNAAEIAKRERATAAEIEYALAVVAEWNATAQQGREAVFFPLSERAIRAGVPILEVLCPGCQTVGSVDLRRLDRHPRRDLKPHPVVVVLHVLPNKCPPRHARKQC